MEKLLCFVFYLVSTREVLLKSLNYNTRVCFTFKKVLLFYSPLSRCFKYLSLTNQKWWFKKKKALCLL